MAAPSRRPQGVLASILISFVAVVVVVEPLGVLPVFLSLTRDRSAADKRRIVARASVIGALVLLAFAIGGSAALRALGIGLDAFKVAGGLVLLLVGLDMVRQKASCRCSSAESDATRDDVAVVPLAIPLLSGPASMASVLALVGRESTLAVVIAIVLVFGVSRDKVLHAQVEELVALTVSEPLSNELQNLSAQLSAIVSASG